MHWFGWDCIFDPSPEVIEVKNHADTMIHSTEKSLKEHGDKIPEADKTSIQSAIDDLKQALTTEQADEIKAKLETLTQVSMKLGEAIYKATQETAASAETTPGSGQDGEKVVDAEFKDLDDQKSA